MIYIKSFVVGGIICVIGQILIDKTKITPARILVTFVCAGVFLGVLGVYKPLIEFAGAGATVPISGFGYLLYEGVKKAVEDSGVLGVMYGGVSNAAAGIAAAIFFGYIIALLFSAKSKNNE